MNATSARGLRAHALPFCCWLALVTLSGAVPVVQVSYEPDEGRLVLLGCPSGSCQERPC